MIACHQQKQQQVQTDAAHYDLTQMKDSGVLVALTLNSSISYFDYRGEPMGFQYELANQFAQSLGLKLVMKTARNTDELVDMLLKGEGDLIAYPLPVTKEWKDTLTFCNLS
jgi:membrane-bound lytic murein transglycosylase F